MTLKNAVRLSGYPSRASRFATSPRCSATRRLSAKRSTSWSAWVGDKMTVAGIEARGFILGGAVAHQLRRLRADPQKGQAAA